MSLILIMVAPKSKFGILAYKDDDNDNEEDEFSDANTIGDIDNNSIDHVDGINR